MRKALALLLLVLLLGGGAVARQRVVDAYDLYAVQTGSMGETAPIGSLVVTERRPVAVGDVVTLDLADGTRSTHRVVGIEGSQLVTQGDANDYPDPYRTPLDRVRGVVVQVHRSGGYALVFLTMPAGFGSLLMAALTMRLAWRLFFPPSQSLPVDDEPLEPGGPGTAAAPDRKVLVLGLLAAGWLLGLAQPAGAQTPDLTFCGEPAPELRLDDALPGEAASIRFDVCNDGATAGDVAFVTTGALGPLAPHLVLEVDGVWSGPVADLGARPAVDAAGELQPGSRRSYDLSLRIDGAAGNDVAGAAVDFDVVVLLTDDGGGTEVLGEVLDRAGAPIRVGSGPLARTGGSPTGAVAVASALVVLGSAIALSGRRARRR
jgi:signal peptidase I